MNAFFLEKNEYTFKDFLNTHKKIQKIIFSSMLGKKYKKLCEKCVENLISFKINLDISQILTKILTPIIRSNIEILLKKKLIIQDLKKKVKFKSEQILYFYHCFEPILQKYGEDIMYLLTNMSERNNKNSIYISFDLFFYLSKSSIFRKHFALAVENGTIIDYF